MVGEMLCWFFATEEEAASFEKKQNDSNDSDSCLGDVNKLYSKTF